MITVAVIGILAAIAYPSYTQYIIRANRSAAQAQMNATPATDIKFCAIDDPTCEACQ